jgi:hypothetical protein
MERGMAKAIIGQKQTLYLKDHFVDLRAPPVLLKMRLCPMATPLPKTTMPRLEPIPKKC